jgi:hypothetical protein
MAEKLNDGTLQTVEQLFEILPEFSKEHPDHTKALVILLNEKDGGYNACFIQAGMTCSQMIALLEVTKTMFLKDMNYI